MLQANTDNPINDDADPLGGKTRMEFHFLAIGRSQKPSLDGTKTGVFASYES
jgi:hypothetical protein